MLDLEQEETVEADGGASAGTEVACFARWLARVLWADCAMDRKPVSEQPGE